MATIFVVMSSLRNRTAYLTSVRVCVKKRRKKGQHKGMTQSYLLTPW